MLLNLLGEKLWFEHSTCYHGSYWQITRPEIYSKVPLERTPHHVQYADGTEIPDDVLHVSSIGESIMPPLPGQGPEVRGPLERTPHHVQYADGTEIPQDILHVSSIGVAIMPPSHWEGPKVRGPLERTPHHVQYADGTEISQDILHVSSIGEDIMPPMSRT